MKFLFLRLVLVTCTLFASSFTFCQPIIINECSNATRGLSISGIEPDADWIELKNISEQPVNLGTYYITDAISKLTKWNLPSITLNSNEFLVVYPTGITSVSQGPPYQTNFGISSEGETIYLTNGLSILQTVNVPATQAHHSSGYANDLGGVWGITEKPSRGSTNLLSSFFPGYASDISINELPGFYAASITLTATIPPDHQIFYTTDGSVPEPTDRIWKGSLIISASATICLRSFQNGKLPSAVVTKTFFIKEPSTIPVLNITADSLTLFDKHNGIYMLGDTYEKDFPYYGSNFWEETEIPVYVEYFSSTGTLIFSQNAGTMIEGGWSRGNPKKSLRIMLDHDYYGDGKVAYPLLPEKPDIQIYNNFVARNGGNGWNSVFFRDAFEQRMGKNLNLEYNAYQPVNLFINGRYWGVYEFRERQDKHYIDYNTGIDDDEIDFIRFNDDTHNIPYLKPLAGSGTGFTTMYNFVRKNDMKLDASYRTFESMMDMDNYIDYFIIQTLFANNDWIGGWTNNIKMWRPNNPVGKWRYVLYDMDMGLCYMGSGDQNKIGNTRHPSAPNEHSYMFDKLCFNSVFRQKFVNRYADLLNTTFLYDSVYSVLTDMKNAALPEMKKDFSRWSNNSISTWKNQVNELMSCFQERRDVTPGNILSEFSLKDTLTIMLEVTPLQSGKIKVNTIIPPAYPWKGMYFKDLSIPFSAIPNSDYVFDHWEINKIQSDKADNFVSTINSINELKAVFRKALVSNNSIKGLSKIEFYPNPVHDFLTVELPANCGAVTLDLYTIQGIRLLSVTFSERIQLDVTDLKSGVYLIKCNGEAKKIIKE